MIVQLLTAFQDFGETSLVVRARKERYAELRCSELACSMHLRS